MTKATAKTTPMKAITPEATALKKLTATSAGTSKAASLK
jgi:hypothetical protein